MFCAVIRRLVSRAEDRGKTLPRFAERHVARCGACRAYARFASSLGARLAAEVPAVLDRAPDVRLDAVLAPDPARSVHETVDRETRGPRRPQLALRLLPAAAAALVVVAGALVLFRIVPREPSWSPAARASALATLKSITAAPGGFRGAMTEAESSLDKERQILEKSVASALEYLQARLNIRIERRELPKTL